MALTEAQKTIISEAVASTVYKAFAPLTNLKKDFQAEYAASTKVKRVNSASAVSANPASYTGAAANGDTVTISMDELNITWQITPADKRNGWRLEDLAKSHAIAFVNDITKRILALPDAASAKVIGAADAFTKKKAISLSGDVESDAPELLLSPDYYRALLPESTTDFSLSSGAYGFNAIHRVKSAAFSNDAVGLAFDPNAIAVCTAIPDIDPEFHDELNQEIITVDGLAGLSIMLCNWIDKNTRTEYASLGIMFGGAILEPARVQAYKAS